MSDVQKCLSVFAVAAWANTPESFDQASAAIEDYVADKLLGRELEALETLRSAYREMLLDSNVANAIRDDIEARIARLSPKPLDEQIGPSVFV